MVNVRCEVHEWLRVKLITRKKHYGSYQGIKLERELHVCLIFLQQVKLRFWPRAYLLYRADIPLNSSKYSNSCSILYLICDTTRA